MTEASGGNAQSSPTPTPTPKKAKAAATLGSDEETQPLETNEAGQQLHDDGMPRAKLARAMAFAAAGKSTDPKGIVTDEQIAAHDPKAAEADKEAVAKFHDDQAEAAREAALEASAEAAEQAAKTEKE